MSSNVPTAWLAQDHAAVPINSACGPSVLKDRSNARTMPSGKVRSLRKRVLEFPEDLLPNEGDFPSDKVRRTFDGIFMPIKRQMELVGLKDTTIRYTGDIIRRVLIKHDVAGVSAMVTEWSVCTRVILADEPHTRIRNPVPGVLHAKTARNSRHLYSMLDRNPCRSISISRWEEVEIRQGNRAIPPWCLDPICIPGMMTQPSFKDKAALVDLSNLKRTLPEGDGQKILQSLRGFKRDTERTVSLFDLRGVSSKLNGIYETSSSREKTRIDISFHGCLDYSRSKGGKTGEFIDKIVEDFICLPLRTLFPFRPETETFDFTGNLVLRPEDWDEERPLWTCLYPEIGCIESKTDNRLGHMALLWALRELRQSEEVNIIVSDEIHNSGCSYQRPAVVKFIDGRIRARVSPQPEEGFKVRVITITSLAVSFIGAAARHFLDEHLWSNELIKIGLLSKVKLYTVLDNIGGRKTSDFASGLYNCTPNWAESVDLTTATNTPPREHVRDILHGHLDAMNHPCQNFLRFSVDLGTSERLFTLDPGVSGPIPGVHKCGIMMGEGLSGIFLNDSSAIIRSIAWRFANEFRSLKGVKHMTNDQADSFIENNRTRIQDFLNSVPLTPNRMGSQSGDDVINFSNESLTASFRILYRIFGFVPSETTWFSSCVYCTFTEEAAIQTIDSNGWKFVDSVKPRAFSTTGGDPDGKVLVSRMRMIGSYIRYFDRNDERRSRAIKMASDMVNGHQAWKRVLATHDIPIGWPEFLGGIEHPIGLSEEYHMTVSMADHAVLQGILKLDPLDAFKLIFRVPEESLGLDSEDLIIDEVQSLVSRIMEFPTFDVYVENCDSYICDLAEVVPDTGVWWKTRNERSKFCSDKNLVVISDLVNSFVQRIKLKTTLLRTEERVSKKSWNMAISRTRSLREKFPIEGSGFQISEVPETTVWKVKDKVMNRVGNLAIPRSASDRLIEDVSLPHLDLCFSTKSREVDLGADASEQRKKIRKL